MAKSDELFTPDLDREHVNHKWVNMDDLPEKLHKVIGKSLREIKNEELIADSMKEEHHDKWIETPQSEHQLT